MISNYFKTAWRSLVFNKRYTAINITGLGVSMAACILIGVFVLHETSYDDQVPRRSDLYRLNEYIHYDGTAPQVSAATGPPIAGFLTNNHPQIESFVRVYDAAEIFETATLEYDGQKFSTARLVCTDTSFANMFGTVIKAGDRSAFIPRKNNMALTQSLAKKIFGKEDALNKMIALRVNDSTVHSYVVSHIIEDFAGNSHLQADALLPVPAEFEAGYLANNYGVLLGPAYLRLQPGTDSKKLEQELTGTIHEKNKFIDMQLQPVADLHAGSTDISYDFFNHNKINGKYINVFIVIAIALFIIACCNFVNLTMAMIAYRGKEIGVKKIAGASRMHVMMQLLIETFLSVLMALALAILLAHVSLPFLNQLLARSIPVFHLYRWPLFALYALVIIIATLGAGIYPAIAIARTRVSLSLRSKVLMGGSRSSVRNVLVTAQFAIAVVFMICLLVFVKQVQFIQNKDLGYSYNQVIKIPIDARDVARMEVLKSGLAQVKGVTGITHGYMELGSSGSLFGIDYVAPDGESKKISVNFENGAPNYVSFFDMKIIQGRNIQAGTEYLVNETLAKQMGYNDAVGKPINLSSWPKGTVVGVVKDYNYSSLHLKIEPLIIGSMDFVPQWKKYLYVKVSTADVLNTVHGVETTLKKLSVSGEVNWQFMDEHFREIYRSEQQAGTLVAVIGGLSVGIACLGLLGLAAFIMAKRTKEIGIRKVLGATVISVAGNLSASFIRLVVIAIVLASPVAYWLANTWLQDFAYRIDIRWWMFALAGGATVLIAFLTVVFLAVKTALANPVVALRNE